MSDYRKRVGAYLIGEDGPQAGTTITFEEGEEWILGRDPDLSYFVLEDPMVSRRHALLRKTEGRYFIENLSTVNPVQVNGEAVTDSRELHEDDSIQIGNSFFRFTERPSEEGVPEKVREVEGEPSRLPFVQERESRWMLKVISGPNQGAEFGMNEGETHIFGKDPAVSDVVFQDLSVSRQHAKISCSKAGVITIEDLNSRNGVFVNGSAITAPRELKSQDLIALGTTSFLLIDREKSRETIYSPPPVPAFEKEVVKEGVELVPPKEEAVGTVRNWKEMFIPIRHLAVASIFLCAIFIGVVSFFGLFRTSEVKVSQVDENKEIEKILKNFPNIQYSHNPNSGVLFLVGHVLTDIDRSELLYLLKSLPFINTIDDNVVVDEGVWEQMNELLSTNPKWRGVKITSSKPGHFVVRGYLPTEAEAASLRAYLNLYFPYLNLLDNEVVVENTLNTQIQSLLVEKGFANVTFQFSNGELIFAGRVNSDEEKAFNDLSDELRKLPGVRQVRNFVIFTTASTQKIDLTANYKVTGSSRFGDVSQFVLINGKILSVGDLLDGMTITEITKSEIDLDKEGIKYKIDYNLQ